MSEKRLLVAFLAGWPLVVVTALMSRAAFVGASLSGPEYAGWFFLAAAPVATCLTILRSRRTAPIAQVLYDVERTVDAGPARTDGWSVTRPPR
ncbi:MAG TPA: hypothetical protein VES67_20750 [Vicinamibacterales bacterium]|nr:hypothetical protein [Vicinamibacterales bacterium]